ncbi:Binding-protein-dependent transport system inner membrane component [Acididesulfobacillus acetoxydans]|uniref:Binding-protein-dependent transport system inner membrane component n=1 Tax=Acididesulfobacillus acetoxydans TaxID=1561005 RepID=A0A8S0X1E4_9FIRM|nr:carbohydrate ABC transporter permease [Acididesulfobacillus acetoxydans]CAA7603091.1 Binding-protein-dependent transport system inner membrane component [Acididesulfobacillus acetoxydans]CEJ05671.1 Inner membrane ABC transporter permease protein YcjP [Acididesulfobacillus acetoxydans]
MFNSKKRKARFLIFGLLALVMVFPFYYMLVLSFTPNESALKYPPQLWPFHPTLSNYVQAWQSNNFQLYFLHSLWVSVISTLLGTIIACAAAFVISRFRFFGRKLIYMIFLGSMMVPSMTFILPQFKEMEHLHLLNSLNGLLLVYTAGMIPFTTFLMKGFFDEVPKEIEDAVVMDGGGKWTLFWRIMMPMALPSLVTAVLFNFMGGWDDYTLALTFINDPHKWTLPIALQLFQGQHTSAWGMIFAASVIQVLPIIAIFIAFQRHIIRGLMAGAVKG